MSVIEIANEIVKLVRAGKMDEAKALYAEDAVSVEAFAPPGMSRESIGLGAIRAKSAWWKANHDVHSIYVAGPWPQEGKFIVGYQFDVTHKPSGRRMLMQEMGLYTVQGGKIVREEFFYNTGA